MADDLRDAAPTSPPRGGANPPFITLSRRRFLAYTGVALVGGGVLGAILSRTLPGGVSQALAPYPRTQIATLGDLRVGKPLAFDYPLDGQPNYLIKLGRPALDGVGPESDIVAFSTTCVHMGCPLANRFKRDLDVLGPCPCHLSTYDLTLGGMPVAGAATENLPQIELAVASNGDITAEGVWGVLYGYENNQQRS